MSGVNAASSFRLFVRPCARTVTGSPSPSTSQYRVASSVVISGRHPTYRRPDLGWTVVSEITVERGPDAVEPMRFLVVVRDAGSSTEHDVTVTGSDLDRLGAGRSPEAFVRACFEFLLGREPKESILRSFDVGLIGRYFPEFEGEISRQP
jgi:hypothetical protein